MQDRGAHTDESLLSVASGYCTSRRKAKRMIRSRVAYRFYLRHIDICDSNCAMRVSMDGIALGAFAATWSGEARQNLGDGCSCSGPRTPDRPLRVLDVGCGSGVVALLIAQHYMTCASIRPAAIDVVGVDIDPLAVQDCEANFYAAKARNPSWSVTFKGIVGDAVRLASSDTALTDARFDVVVCNPPYFDAGGVLKSQPMCRRREVARLRGSLDTTQVMQIISAVLARSALPCCEASRPRGYLIYPYPEPRSAINESAFGLSVSREVRLKDRQGKPDFRSIVELVEGKHDAQPVLEMPLHRSALDRKHSAEYGAVVHPFLPAWAESGDRKAAAEPQEASGDKNSK